MVVGGFTVDCFVVGCELLVFSTLAGGSVFVRRSQRERPRGRGEEERGVGREGERKKGRGRGWIGYIEFSVFAGGLSAFSWFSIVIGLFFT